MSRRRIPLAQFHQELKAQGVPIEHVAFKCPACQTIQSPADLIRLKVGTDLDQVEKYAAFSCVGRFTGAGPVKSNEPPGRGCDWTLGGLLQLHTLEIELPDGKICPRFELASPEEAQAHMQKGGAA